MEHQLFDDRAGRATTAFSVDLYAHGLDPQDGPDRATVSLNRNANAGFEAIVETDQERWRIDLGRWGERDEMSHTKRVYRGGELWTDELPEWIKRCLDPLNVKVRS